jgi:hypothetical protein
VNQQQWNVCTSLQLLLITSLHKNICVNPILLMCWNICSTMNCEVFWNVWISGLYTLGMEELSSWLAWTATRVSWWRQLWPKIYGFGMHLRAFKFFEWHQCDWSLHFHGELLPQCCTTCKIHFELPCLSHVLPLNTWHIPLLDWLPENYFQATRWEVKMVHKNAKKGL